MNFTRQKCHRALAFRYYKKAYGYIRADYRRCHFGPHDDVLKNLIIKFPPLIEDCNDNFMEADKVKRELEVHAKKYTSFSPLSLTG